MFFVLAGHRRRIVNNLPRTDSSTGPEEVSSESVAESTYDLLPKRSSISYGKQPVTTQDALYDELPKVRVDLSYMQHHSIEENEPFTNSSYLQHNLIADSPP